MVYQVVNPANHDQTLIAAPLLLDFKSRNDIISTNDYCQMLQKLCMKITN